jgi:hypothetical protein
MVTQFSGKYVVDEKGKTASVLLDIKTYRRLISELEELEAMRAYEAAKASCDEAIPFDLAVQEIEAGYGYLKVLLFDPWMSLSSNTTAYLYCIDNHCNRGV